MESELNELLDSNRSVAHIVGKSAAFGLVDILELGGNDRPTHWSQEIAAWIEQDGIEVVSTLPDLS